MKARTLRVGFCTFNMDGPFGNNSWTFTARLGRWPGIEVICNRGDIKSWIISFWGYGLSVARFSCFKQLPKSRFEYEFLVGLWAFRLLPGRPVKLKKP